MLSPAGVGYDCYRSWEVLMTGTMLAVERSPGFDKVFDDLPVLQVGRWLREC